MEERASVKNGHDKQVDNAEGEFETLHLPELSDALSHIPELLSQPNQSFILGAGFSKCANLPLMTELTQIVTDGITEGKNKEILNAIVAKFKESDRSTIEDYMSEIVDLISILDRRNSRLDEPTVFTLRDKEYSVDELNQTLLDIKDQIRLTLMQAEVNVDVHRRFVRAIHGRLKLGKSEYPLPANYFTLNYDTLIEDALAMEQILTTDGFQGGATGWWDIDAYDDPGVKARVFKIHGSIDWTASGIDYLPRRIRSGLNVEGDTEPVLLWPAATKYRESQQDPYAQIIDKMRDTLSPGANEEIILSVIGYSFGDSHINFEIDRALRKSKGRLTILVFSSEDKPFGIVQSWLADSSINGNVRLHAKHGFYHGDQVVDSEAELPWWRFETLTRILGGEQ